MQLIIKKLPLVTVLIMTLLAFAVIACNYEPSSQEQETERQQSSYDLLVANQPALEAKYSPTRKTVNFFVETWLCEACEGKPAFVYIKDETVISGYYIMEGPPVSYCAMLTPDYRVLWNSVNDTVVKAPSLDGAFYSGGQCLQYYGRDLATGQYMEFTIGGTQNYFLFEEPMPLETQPKPLGHTNIEDVWDSDTGEFKEGYQQWSN